MLHYSYVDLIGQYSIADNLINYWLLQKGQYLSLEDSKKYEILEIEVYSLQKQIISIHVKKLKCLLYTVAVLIEY